MNHAKAVLYWCTPEADIELGCTLDRRILRAVKKSIIRAAKHRLISVLGDPEREEQARHELQSLQTLLDTAIPDTPLQEDTRDT